MTRDGHRLKSMLQANEIAEKRCDFVPDRAPESVLAALEQADLGIGRGPGGPPHFSLGASFSKARATQTRHADL